MSFKDQVINLVQRHGTTRFVVQAMEELGVSFADDVVDETFFLKRCDALKEEND